MTNDQCNRLINLLSSIDIKLDKILKKNEKRKSKRRKGRNSNHKFYYS